jgi:hypothetical protein
MLGGCQGNLLLFSVPFCSIFRKFLKTRLLVPQSVKNRDFPQAGMLGKLHAMERIGYEMIMLLTLRKVYEIMLLRLGH